MKQPLKPIIIVVLLFAVTTAQFRSELPVQSLPTNLNGELDAQPSLALFDPGRFNFSHGFTMSMLSKGNHSFSIMGLNSNMNYLITDNLTLDANFTLYQAQLPFQRQGEILNQLDIAYDAGITYKPTKNSFLQLRFQNLPHNQKYQTRSPFNMRFIR
jgi:hypothetical protein